MFVDDFVKGLFALIAILTDFMASAPKLVLVAVFGSAATAVCGMCVYCCQCHKPIDDIEESDDEDESSGGARRGPVAFKAKALPPRAKQQHRRSVEDGV